MSTTDLTGTWQLMSATAQRSDGRATQPYGRHPRGILIYGSDGRMVTVIVHGDLGPFESESIVSASANEAAHAFRRTLAYYGRYEVNDEAGTVVHHLEACTFPNWTGADEIRHFQLDGDRLVLTTPPLGAGGGDEAVFTLVLERR